MVGEGRCTVVDTWWQTGEALCDRVCHLCSSVVQQLYLTPSEHSVSKVLHHIGCLLA